MLPVAAGSLRCPSPASKLCRACQILTTTILPSRFQLNRFHHHFNLLRPNPCVICASKSASLASKARLIVNRNSDHSDMPHGKSPAMCRASLSLDLSATLLTDGVQLRRVIMSCGPERLKSRSISSKFLTTATAVFEPVGAGVCLRFLRSSPSLAY